MASQSKNSKKNSKGKVIVDDRVPKLIGILFIFIAAYLFFAFLSYIFTWQDDYNNAFFDNLFNGEIQVKNWLGRLGAITSNIFIYWGFGIPSFIVTTLLFKLGMDLILGKKLKNFARPFFFSILLLVFSSVLLEFLFFNSKFPWGGAIGGEISNWLQNFLGALGLSVFFVALILSGFVWYLNPNLDSITFQGVVQSIKIFFTDLVQGKLPQPNRVKVQQNTNVNEAVQPFDVSANPNVLKPSGANAVETKKSLLRENQLSFELEERKRAHKVESLQVGDTSLEIETNVTESQDIKDDSEVAPALGLNNSANPLKHDVIASQENKNHSEPYDPTLELSSYELPPTGLLNSYDENKVSIDKAELEANKDHIIETLLNYKIEITKIRATIGPTVTLYEIVPAAGVRISKIKNLEDDIALSLAALGIRIIAPIPGRGTIGIEVPNKKRQIVSLKETLITDKFKRAKMDLPIALGKTINNEVFVADLAKMPHLLIAGATGQGKSVGINTILMSLLYKKHPSQVKLVLIDPKKVELFPYAQLASHYLAFMPDQDEPITTETSKVVTTLHSLTLEMDQRYNLLKAASARNIREYNDKFVARRLNPNKGHKFLPFIVLIIDEFADLIMTAGKEVELPIGRLAQLARAVGIHLIIATQRPSVNIITGVIKANFPARIAFKVTSKIDSRTILDGGGADQLVGRGDMLLSVGGDTIRLQGAFVDTPEVEEVLKFISSQQGYAEPYWLPEFHTEEGGNSASGIKFSEVDEHFEDAARLIVANQHGSTSMIQRRLKLGYNRAGRIMDQLEAFGIVGPNEGSKAREVLVTDEIELSRHIDLLRNSG